jgi:hypothetical protein
MECEIFDEAAKFHFYTQDQQRHSGMGNNLVEGVNKDKSVFDADLVAL